MGGRRGAFARNHVAAYRRVLTSIEGAVLAIILVLIMGVVTPLSASAVTDGYMDAANNTSKVTVELKATVRDGNGAEMRKTFKGDDLRTIENVVPDKDMSFYVDVHLRDDAVVNDDGSKKLKWEYPFGIPAVMVKDQSEINQVHTVREGGRTVATVTLRKDAQDKLYLQVEFDEEYAKDKSSDFFFSYNLQTIFQDELIPDDGKMSWEFPGVGTTITVQREAASMSGSKSCNWKGSSQTDLTCTVRLNASGDVKNFKFEDTHGANLRITSNMIARYESGAKDDTEARAAADKMNEQFKNGGTTLDFGNGKLPKGTYVITYDTKIDVPEGTSLEQFDYSTASNTAKWKWGDGKEGESTYTPSFHKLNINWVNKYGELQSETVDDGDGKKVKVKQIKWTVKFNDGGDKGDLRGRTFEDILDDKQTFTGTASIRVNDGREMSAADFVAQHPEMEGLFPAQGAAGTHGFTFPDNDDYNKYEVIYYTTVADDRISDPSGTVYTNTITFDCAPLGCEEWQQKKNARVTKPAPSGNTPVEPDNPDDPQYEEPQFSKTGGEPRQISGRSAYIVPWTLEYTPPASDQDPDNNPQGSVRKLRLYEDWVNGVSDGNTKHMWYSKDYLDLKVEVYRYDKSKGGCGSYSEGKDDEACWAWTTVPADKFKTAAADKRSANDKKDKGFPEEYCSISNQWQDASSDARELPDGARYPEGFLKENMSKYNGQDTYDMHDGAPAFTFAYDQNDVMSNYDAGKWKMRITYNTLCDGEPDTYINYAKFRYEQGGKSYDTVLSANVSFQGDGAGKTVAPENVGKHYWNNQAVCDEKTGKCVAHWRVWANGKQSWWSIKEHDLEKDANGKVTKRWYEELPGISGVNDLSASPTITMTDMLPKGWTVDTDSIYGRFVSMPDYDTKPDVLGEDVGNGWHSVPDPNESERIRMPQNEETFKVAENKNCDGNTCATYTYDQDARTFTVTVPNDGSLTSWNTTVVGDATAGSETGGGPLKHYPPHTPKSENIARQTHSIVVFEFDTKISKAELDRQGLIDGAKNTYTNTAEVSFGGKTSAASGDIFVAKGDAPKLGKHVGNTGENTLEFVVEIDLTGNDYTSGQTIVLKDSLGSPNSYYIDGSFVLATDQGREAAVSPQPTVVIAKDAVTHRQTATISFNPAELYNGEYPLNGDKGPLYKGKKFKLFYDVAVKGIPGQQIDVSNSVKFGGSMEGSASAHRPVTIQIPTADAGATGSITATKVSADDNTTPLAGAEFKMCQVDTGKPVKDNGVYGGSGVSGKAWPCTGDIHGMTTGANGQLTFSNGSGANNGTSVFNRPQNTLFVAWETKAPEGYVVNTMPQYFYLKYLRADDADTALRTISSYADGNGIYVLDTAFSIVDPPTGLEWGKVDESDVETNGSSVALKEGAPYLGGSAWSLTSTACGNGELVIPGTDIACVAAIVDNQSAKTETINVFEGEEHEETITLTRQLADTTPADGKLKVTGLPTGTYILKETEAPDGYEMPDESRNMFQVTLTDAGTMTWVNVNVTGSLIHGLMGSDWKVTEFVIGNEPGVELPSAGGIGTHFAAFGLACVAAGMALAVIAQKNRKPGAHAAPRIG